MDFISDFVLTIAVCFLVPFLLCFLLPVLVALCPSRDNTKDHVGERKVLYECKPKTHEWESGFVEKAVEVDKFLGEPKKESLNFEEFLDEGSESDENKVSGADGVGCLKEKSVEEESFDGDGDLCGFVNYLFDESSERDEVAGIAFDSAENEVGAVCLPEKNVEGESFDGHSGVCGDVDYLFDDSSERHEFGGLEFDLAKNQVGVVTLPEKCVEQESCVGFGDMCGCVENLVDESSERHEFGDIEYGLAGNQVGVVRLQEKCVEEESSTGHGGICGCVENLVDESSEKQEFGETEFGLARNQVGIVESEEIKVSKCDANDVTDGAKNNVVDGVVNEGLFSEDDDWEGIERTELERLFAASVVFVGSKSNADRVSSLGSDVKMRLDGLHKIATRGPCLESQPMAFMVTARAKWNAWQQLGNMSAEVAMEQYITLLTESVPGWMQDVHGDFADPQVYEKVTSDVKTLVPNQSEAAAERKAEELKPDIKGLNEIGVGVVTR